MINQYSHVPHKIFWSIMNLIYDSGPPKIIMPSDTKVIFLYVSMLYEACPTMKSPNDAFLRRDA
jgi:hypothetical protein